MNIQNSTLPVTSQTAQWITGLDPKTLPTNAYARAKHAVLDYFGCAIAGQNEPLVTMMREEFAGDNGDGPCTIIASNQSATLHNSTLINGAMAHALDYDDVHFRLHGHPTTCIAPAAITLGEMLGASGQDILTAFIIGTEVACALGEMAEEGHYDVGFHATGTIGTFGAAAAAARLLGLDKTATTNALGLAASQAAGLKINFGTMTKPFHAGKAAMNGVIAARLAARGFTANDTAIEGPQGFAEAQVASFRPTLVRPDETAAYAVEEILFKFHASCFLTHSTLNAIATLRRQHGFALDDVETTTLKIRSTHALVCCIAEPTTDLGIKFSIQHLAAMGLDGINTGALETFSHENANNPRFVHMRRRVDLEYIDDMPRTAVTVNITLKDGKTLSASDDVGVPAEDTADQWQRLATKFDALVAPVIGSVKTSSLIDAIANLETADNVSGLMKTAG